MFKKIIDKWIVRSTPMNIMGNRANSTDAHLIALCRILFIKPEVLYREVNNNKANAEYILKLLEVKQNEDKKV